MSIAAINEKLLRAIGVGIALADPEGLRLRFQNKSFETWFGAPELGTPLEEVLAGLDVDAMIAALNEGRIFSAELTVKPKRRSLIIAVTFSMAEVDGASLVVLECQNITRIRELESMIESYSAMVEKNARELRLEKERAEKLLLNIMPKAVYDEFKSFGVVTPQLYDPVSVLMLDFVGFTQMASEIDPTVLVGELNDIFTAFDRITEQFGCERIKTIGDAYLAVAGLPEANPDHARSVANVAIRLVKYIERRNISHPHKWRCRVGLATGPVVGSVVGIQKYVYDIFGPAVNMAARLQAEAEPMTIKILDSMKGMLVEEFELDDMGKRDLRGFGEIRLLRLGGPARKMTSA